MVQSLLRYAAMAMSAIVILSFGMFVNDQTASGSAKDVATINAEDGNGAQSQQQPPPEPKAPKGHGQPRKAIEGADKTLTQPFDGLVRNSSSSWVRKAVPSFAALLVFGLGLTLVAAYVPR
jgi:hypothetical protein